MIRWLLALALLACAPAWGQAITVYVSKCGPQAASGCIAGNNAVGVNSTTASTPIEDFTNINLSTIAAGSTVRLACGGHWADPGQWYIERLTDLNVTIEPYQHPGGGAPTCNITPVLPLSGYSGSDTRPRMTYSDNSNGIYCQGGSCNGLRVDGLRFVSTGSTSSSAFFINAPSSNVTITRVDADGFAVPYVPNTNVGLGDPIHRYWTFRGNRSANGSHGWLGGVSESLIEGNLFTRNNRHVCTPASDDTCGGQQHAMYWTCPANVCKSTVIRGNLLYNNSINISVGQSFSGKCNGGNFTARGRVEDLVFDGNTIINDEGGSTARCYGYSIGAGYRPDPAEAYGTEWWRRGVIRNTTIVGVNYGVAVTTATSMLVENIRFVTTSLQSGEDTRGFYFPHRDYDNINFDDADSGMIVRNALCYFSVSPGSTGTCVHSVDNSGATMGTGVQLVNIHAHFVSNTNNAYAFNLKDTPADYSRIQGLAVTGSNRLWRSSYTTQSAFNTRFNDIPSGAVAGAVDAASADFATTPSSGNNYACTLNSGSPLVNAGSASGARLGFGGEVRVGATDIGACQDR